MTRLVAGLLVVSTFLLFAVDGLSATTEVTLPGDANCDGQVNSIDSLLVLQMSAGLLTELACPKNAEVSGDSRLDSIDSALILQFGADLISSFVPGVSNTQVTIGTHTSLTGPIAAYNVIPNFTKAYFEHINATEGGVNGRAINYLLRDDQYSPPRAIDLTRELVEDDRIFAMFNALGTPNHLQVVDYLQQKGVPDMYVVTGAIEWVRDPSARPYVFGSNVSYTGEGLAIGKWIIDTMGPEASVGVIYENSDFGKDGLAGLKLAVPVASAQSYEVTDPDLTAQIDELRSNDVDIVVMFATPLLLGNGVRHARGDGWDVQFAISAVSMNELTALIASAPNIEGAVGPVTTYQAYQTTIPAIARHIELLNHSEIQGYTPSALTLYAQYAAELMVKTLQDAGRDLTRERLIGAAESLSNWRCSVCLFPVWLGPSDHDPAQSVAFGEFRDGKIAITTTAYTWEGVSVDNLSLETIRPTEVPANAPVLP